MDHIRRYQIYEVNTGAVINAYQDERDAWAKANMLNDSYSEAMGLEYSVKAAGGNNG